MTLRRNVANQAYYSTPNLKGLHTSRLVDVRERVGTTASEQGVRWLEVRNPRGISCDLNLDGALDIGWASAGSVPLAWASPNGYFHPSRRHDLGDGWRHTFGGGFLSTCGMRSTGAPSSVDGRSYGLHGNLSLLSVREYEVELPSLTSPAADIVVRALIVDAPLGEAELALTREFRFDTARPILNIRDRIHNCGSHAEGIMYRHHFNLGFPVIDQGTIVSGNVQFDRWRDGARKSGVLPWKLELENGAPEEVAYFDTPDSEPVCVSVRNSEGSSVSFEFDGGDWTKFILWRVSDPGVNVLGIEPATSGDDGRAQAIEDDEILQLLPRCELSFETRVSINSA